MHQLRSIAFCALVLLAGATAANAAEKPNIIFIMADDLGYGDLGCFGQQKIATPNLDEMAREGMRLTNFYAGCTVCAPSRCVLMTGLHTGHCFIRGNAKDNLRPSDVTVAKVLKEAGYQTALIGKWGLGHEGSTGVPTRQGFDYFFGYLDQTHAHNYYPTYLMRNEERFPLKNVPLKEGQWGQGIAKEKVDYSHDLCMDEAMKWIDGAAKKDAPFFLYLALTIPHANNEAGKEGMEVPDYGDYANKDWPEPQKGHAAMISRMDRDLGKLFAKLKADGIDDNTLVIFTSDNGPHREGGNDPDFADSNGPLQGIKRSLHEGGIRVPTIVRWPGHVKAGSESDFAGAFWDVMPTLAAVAGDSDKVPSDIDGISFLPTLTGMGTQKQHDYLYWAFYEGGGAQAVRLGDWKAIQQPINTPVRLYNLKNDLGEEHDLAADNPEKVAEMTKLMAAAYTPSDSWKFPEPKAKKNNAKGKN
ncbi:arylsulfatase [Blastopirellula sp. JC732]|uniref:Arylsulfatase n=1 Tax=Blastopirellula sediminis TaxID=2894196 RepID=A0A9X1MRF1_9BACT|nr:arylsulfatase [Blastopirellula sediminis]MCC9604698.1 arylsulfatase [Blastopirellula sediminis]MCC9632003.1 arylsulfatase [Blastopirellula sediminis]